MPSDPSNAERCLLRPEGPTRTTRHSSTPSSRLSRSKSDSRAAAPCHCTTSTLAVRQAWITSATGSSPNTPTRFTVEPSSVANSSRARSGATRRALSVMITPTYEAPSRAASRTSSSRVTPQNLTSVTRGCSAELLSAWRPPDPDRGRSKARIQPGPHRHPARPRARHLRESIRRFRRWRPGVKESSG